jgi:hypothetical protein
MAQYEQMKKDFMAMFANDPDIKIIPLPDSVREKLGIYQDVSYVPPTTAVNKCLFSGNRYSGYEERPAVEDIEFPDLSKLAKPEAIVEIKEEEKEDNRINTSPCELSETSSEENEVAKALKELKFKRLTKDE